MFLPLLFLAQATTADFKSRLDQHRKLEAGTGVGGLVIMDLARAADIVCSVDADWPKRVEAFSSENSLTDDEAMLLGYYCIVYAHGAIKGAERIVKTVP